MLNKIKTSIQSLKNLNYTGINPYVVYILLFATILIVGLALNRGTWAFILEYFRFNILQLIILIVVSTSVFYNSYRRLTRKSPSKWLILFFILSVFVLVFNTFSINNLIESYNNKAHFSMSTYTFINLALLSSGIFLGVYDFPRIANLKEMYVGIRENFHKNLGLFLFIFFLVALGGLMNRTYVYPVTAVLLLIQVYLFKVLLSNLRK